MMRMNRRTLVLLLLLVMLVLTMTAARCGGCCTVMCCRDTNWLGWKSSRCDMFSSDDCSCPGDYYYHSFVSSACKGE